MGDGTKVDLARNSIKYLMEDRLTIEELFSRFMNNDCSAVEIERLMAYFATDHEPLLKSLIRVELERVRDAGAWERQVDRMVQGVRKELLRQVRNEKSFKRLPKGMSRPWKLLAAVGLVLVCSGLFLLLYWPVIRDRLDPVRMETVSTSRGQRKMFLLSDGTKIWLGPSGSLQYPDRFGDNLREVQMEGEAFFEVAKDQKHPFVIHSGGMDTRVVGTSFMVRAFKDRPEADVTVVTGRVRVSLGRKMQAVVVIPNQRALLNRDKGSLTSENYPGAAQMLKRRLGILTYDGAPVTEVIADFCRYYNLAIVLEGQSAGCLCYGEFDTNKPVNIVLEQLAAAINATVGLQYQKYVIRLARAADRTSP